MDRWRLYSAGELGQFPGVEWLIPQWLAAGELTVLFGVGGSFKSFVALSWACQLAAEGKTCVYIAAEGTSGIRKRIAAWEIENQIASPEQMLITTENVALHQPKEVANWISSVSDQIVDRELPMPELIVVDTLARNFVGGDENSAKEMGQFVEGCEVIRKEFGAAVVPIHHTKKGDSATERGGLSLRNSTFAMHKTTVSPVRGSGAVRVQLRCDRMKDAEPPGSVFLDFKKVPLPGIDGEGESETTSLALAHPFPPNTTSTATAHGELREQTILILKQDGRLGVDKVGSKLRTGKLKFSNDLIRELLKEWTEDPDVPIDHTSQGFGISIGYGDESRV